MKPTYTPPQKIISLRDDNELEFEKELAAEKNKVTMYAYKYTKSLTKKGLHLLITEKGITDGLKHGTFMV